jgi:4-hydroxybenzoate polyprenyltransferase
MIKAIISLTRLDKPVGIYLLWFPCAWALSLAYRQLPPLSLFLYFGLGTIIMRSAGCVINDIADRRFDSYVSRTQTRPLANQSLSLEIAWIVLTVLLFAALIILQQLPRACLYAAIPAVIVTFIYPFCKRFFKTPQLVLGLAFSMSIPMVNIASQQAWSAPWTLIWLITIFWVIAYDTQYALSDIQDDLKLGILSTAIFFKDKVYLAIGGLQTFVILLWLLLAWLSDYSMRFYLASLFGGIFWLIQAKKLTEDPLCAFKNNTWYGLWMWMALSLEKL